MKTFQTLRTLKKVLFVVALASCGLSKGFDFYDDSGEDLRLRLGDKNQELLTTSVNWFDLLPKDPHPRVERSEVDVPSADKRLRIVLDAGHGGRDLGATGYGILEKSLCLRISRMVRRHLERYEKLKDFPVEVRLSRDSDTFIPLGERVRIANDWNADLFVSIHGNASEFPRARGFEVYFLNAEASDADARSLARFENGSQGASPLRSDVLSILTDIKANQHVTESSALADAVFSSMAQHLHASGRGVRQAPFKVLHGTSMPAVLVEVGYLTNDQEADKLTKGIYLKRLANAISTGIIDFAITLKKKVI